MSQPATPAAHQFARIFVDPVCPFAWITSRWLLKCTESMPLDVEFAIISISALNEGRDVDPDYRRLLDRAWGPSRVMAAVAADHGPDGLRRFYDAVGTRIHVAELVRVDGVKDYAATLAPALIDAGLPTSLADAATDDTWDPQLRDETQRALAPVGGDVGTPIIHLADDRAQQVTSPVKRTGPQHDSQADATVPAFFGPVLTSIPRGQAALGIWDAVVALAHEPAFTEFKRGRTQALQTS